MSSGGLDFRLEAQDPGSSARAASSGNRLLGYDVARAMAIFGMMIVHFYLVMSAVNPGTGWVNILVEALDGRAAALFMVLAGVGVALRTRRAAVREGAKGVATVASSLRRRGLFLLVVGFLNLLVWQGDILRVYGVLLIGFSFFLELSSVGLVVTGLAFVAGFIGLMPLLDYGKNWNWTAMEYRHLWTASGLARNLFYDGFRSVFPWGGLFCAGMWLGQCDLSRPLARMRLALTGFGLIAIAVVASYALRNFTAISAGLDAEEAAFLFGTASMPPLPIFLLTAVGFAGTAIAFCHWLVQRFANGRIVNALAATGRMALTWYFGHIVFGLGGIILLGLHTSQPPALAVTVAAAFFLVAMVCSSAWMKRHPHGPLEALLRRVAEQAEPKP